MTGWVALGIGPWANSGELQVELIHQDDDARSIFTEFLDAGRLGFHQLAYWTTEFAATMASIRESGWPVVWAGGQDVGTRFAYVEPPDCPAAVIEIMKLNDATEGMGRFLREAAAGWDGADPVRDLGA